ncbi:MAG: hypothetical protein IT436_13755 [Phycisphaerales bacterium]|nr:hypothetical protein [Phycisphaerales bacterium]
MLACVPLFAAAALGVGVLQPAGHVIVDAGLNRTPAEILEITPERIRYIDRERTPRTVALSEVLALLPARPDDLGEPVAAEASGRGLAVRIAVELTDGQRFVGKPAFTEVKDGLAWDTRMFGRLELPLERVRSISLHPEVVDLAGRAAGKDDEVDLLNGDRVAGLVEAFGPAVVVESGGQRITIGPDRVAAVMLANPDAAPPRSLARLEDGAVFAIEGIRTTGEARVELMRPEGAGGKSRKVTAALGEVAAVWFDAPRLTPLSRLGIDRYEASPGRRWTRAPRIYGGEMGSAGDIEVPGPMTVEWVLPPAQRFAGTLVLPRRSLEWGDGEVTIEVRPAKGAEGWTTLVKERLNAARPSAEFNVELPAGPARLRLKLEPGADGTIQDRVVLRDAVLLTGK